MTEGIIQIYIRQSCNICLNLLLVYFITFVDLHLGQDKGKPPRSNSVNKVYLIDYKYNRLIFND